MQPSDPNRPPQDDANRLRDGASRAAGDLGDSASRITARAGSAAGDIGQDLHSGVERGALDLGDAAPGPASDLGGSDLGGMVSQRRQQLEGFVRDRPVPALLAAFAVGYVIGKMR